MSEKSMLPIPPEEKALLKQHLTESARILRKYTEPEKQKDFGSIEVEVRTQMLEIVGPTMGEFFFRRGKKTVWKQAKNQNPSRRSGNKPKTSQKTKGVAKNRLKSRFREMLSKSQCENILPTGATFS